MGPDPLLAGRGQMAWDPCWDTAFRGSHAPELGLENLALQQLLAGRKVRQPRPQLRARAQSEGSRDHTHQLDHGCGRAAAGLRAANLGSSRAGASLPGGVPFRRCLACPASLAAVIVVQTVSSESGSDSRYRIDCHLLRCAPHSHAIDTRPPSSPPSSAPQRRYSCRRRRGRRVPRA